MFTEIRYIFYRDTLTGIFWSFKKFQRSLQKVATDFTDDFQSKSICLVEILEMQTKKRMLTYKPLWALLGTKKVYASGASIF